MAGIEEERNFSLFQLYHSAGKRDRGKKEEKMNEIELKEEGRSPDSVEPGAKPPVRR